MSPQPPSEGVHLEPSWPGLEAPDGQLHADTDVMVQVGRRLAAQAGSLRTDASRLPSGVSYLDDYRRSTTAGLEDSTDVADDDHWFGRWVTAGDMEHGWRTARWSILTYYKRLVKQLDAAGRTLEETAGAYESGEAANRAELLLAAHGQAGETRGTTAAPALGHAPAGFVRESTQVPRIGMCEAVHEYDPRWILDEIDHLRTRRPWIDMSASASALRATSERLHHLHDWIRQQAATLAEAWCSPAAAACQQALRRLAATAAHLADRSAELGEFTARSADAVATAVSGFPTLEGRSFTEWVQDTLTIGADPNRERRQNEVRDALARLNQAYTDINHTTLPARVDAELTTVGAPYEPGPDSRAPPQPPALLPPPLAGPTPDGAGAARAGNDAMHERVGDEVGDVAESHTGLPSAGVVGSTGGLAAAAPTPPAGPQSPPVIGGSGAAPGSGGPPPGPGPGGGTVPGVTGPGGVPGPRTPGGASGVPGAGATGGVRGAGPGAAGRGAGTGMLATPLGAASGQGGGATRHSSGRAGLVGGPSPGGASRSPGDETLDGADDWLVDDETRWEGEQDVPPEVIK